ncbi:MAG: flagellar hook-length control protein FliK [Candidatus Fimivivens sp.]
MNNMTVQTPQVVTSPIQSASIMPKSLEDLNTGSLGNNAAHFLNLLTAVLDTGGESALTAQLKKDAEILGAQMNAEMLTLNPLFTVMLTDQSTQATPNTLQQNAVFGPSRQLQSLSSTANLPLSSELLSQLQQAIEAAETPVSTNASSATTFATAAQATGRDGDATASILLNAASDEASALQGQSRFAHAVTLARQLLKSANQPAADTGEIDLDDLQKKVDAGAFLSQLTTAANTGTTIGADQVYKNLDAQALFNQIQTSLTQHVHESVTDFTITLSPEGLGKITVKLLEDGGKTTLSLAASNANVQRLLGSELNNLRDIMRPYNVEVTQVVQSNEPQNMDMQQQFSQHFSGHNHPGQHPTSSFAYDPDYGEIAPSGDLSPPVTLPDSVLDAYI